MQIAVLMSFVVICCFSRSAIIKKEKNFFMSVWGGAIPESERRELNKISRTIKSLFFFSCFLYRSVWSRRFVFISSAAEKTFTLYFRFKCVWNYRNENLWGLLRSPLLVKAGNAFVKTSKTPWNQSFSHQASWFSFWIWKLKWVFWLSHSVYLPIVSYQH